MDQILPLSGQLLSLPLASGPVNVDQRCDVMKPHEASLGMPGSYASYMPAHKAASADWLPCTDFKDLLVHADLLSSLSLLSCMQDC